MASIYSLTYQIHMKTITRIIIFLVVTQLVCATTQSAPPIPSKFHEVTTLPDYFGKIKIIYEKHVCNHKVVAKLKSWDLMKFDTNKIYVTTHEEMIGEHAILDKHKNIGPTGDSEESGGFMSSDDVYGLHRDSKTGKYKISKHVVEWNDPDRYHSAFMSSWAVSSQVYSFVDHKDDKLIGAPKPVDFEGRKAIKLEFTVAQDIPKTLYLDQDTYQFLYSEMPRSFDFSTNQVVANKQIVRTTYQTVAGKRVPLRHEMYKQKPSGEKIPWLEMEFTEYTPYIPTADDLDLEKQFGVKPIQHEPRPASAMGKKGWLRPASWWYLAGAVFLAVTVGLVLFARKRRATS